VIVFFVTSSDSGSLVIDTITAGGKIDAPVAAARVLVHCFEGLSPLRCFWAGGSQHCRRWRSRPASPSPIVLLLACFAILKGLHSEPR
jgi:BCCT family betaine/carnitine transporter